MIDSQQSLWSLATVVAVTIAANNDSDGLRQGSERGWTVRVVNHFKADLTTILRRLFSLVEDHSLGPFHIPAAANPLALQTLFSPSTFTLVMPSIGSLRSKAFG